MYTDPGSGLFFTQALAAALITIFYRFRRVVADVVQRTVRVKAETRE